MTKIMLLNVVYEQISANNISFDEEITVSERASGMGGSQVYLESGGTYKLSTLLKSIIVASANDASVTLAERFFGSEEECVKVMNEKVNRLGLKNTLFSNCTGLPKPMQYSSAKDIALIFADLIKYENDRLTPFWGKNGEPPTIPCCSDPDFKPTEKQLQLYKEYVLDS